MMTLIDKSVPFPRAGPDTSLVENRSLIMTNVYVPIHSLA